MTLHSHWNRAAEDLAIRGQARDAVVASGLPLVRLVVDHAEEMIRRGLTMADVQALLSAIRLCICLNDDGRLCGLSFALFGAKPIIEEMLIHRAVLMVTDIVHRAENRAIMVEDCLRQMKGASDLAREYAVLKAVEGQQAAHFESTTQKFRRRA